MKKQLNFCISKGVLNYKGNIILTDQQKRLLQQKKSNPNIAHKSTVEGKSALFIYAA